MWQRVLYVNHDVADKLTYDFLEYYLNNATEITITAEKFITNGEPAYHPYSQLDYDDFGTKLKKMLGISIRFHIEILNQSSNYSIMGIIT